MSSFISMLLDFVNQIMAYDFLPGLTVFSVLFYPFVVVLVFAVFTRRAR